MYVPGAANHAPLRQNTNPFSPCDVIYALGLKFSRYVRKSSLCLSATLLNCLWPTFYETSSDRMPPSLLDPPGRIPRPTYPSPRSDDTDALQTTALIAPIQTIITKWVVPFRRLPPSTNLIISEESSECRTMIVVTSV